MGSSVVMIAPRRDCGGGVCRERGERGGVGGDEWVGTISVLVRLNRLVRAGAEAACCAAAISALFVLLRFDACTSVASLLLRFFPCAIASATACGSAGSCGRLTVALRPRGPRFTGSRG